MKSNKQRRAEIQAHRRARTLRARAQLAAEPRALGHGLPADTLRLAALNNTYGALPACYVDRPFTCRDCGAAAVWAAAQQKWWYEAVGASLCSTAVRCLACRRARRAALQASRAGEGADRLGEQAARLRALGASAPTASARAEVEQALQSKWWGLRVLAIQALGRWRSAADTARLQALMRARTASWFDWTRVAADAAAQALR